MTLPAQDIVERLERAKTDFWAHTRMDCIRDAKITISRLTADNEVLRKNERDLFLARNSVENLRQNVERLEEELAAAEARADALAQEVERLKTEKENLQGVLQAAHDALKRDMPAKAFHAVRAAIRALANEEAER